jgi:hypothetical protein
VSLHTNHRDHVIVSLPHSSSLTVSLLVLALPILSHATPALSPMIPRVAIGAAQRSHLPALGEGGGGALGQSSRGGSKHCEAWPGDGRGRSSCRGRRSEEEEVGGGGSRALETKLRDRRGTERWHRWRGRHGRSSASSQA